MDWVLIITVVILLAGAAVGFAKGGVKIAVSLLTTMVTLVLVTLSTPYVTDIIKDKTPFGEMIEEQIIGTMSNMAIENVQEGVGISEEKVRGMLDAVGMSEETLDSLGVTVDDIVSERVTSEDLADIGISSSILEAMKDNSAVEEVVENVELSREEQIAVIESAKLPKIFKSLLKENNNSEIYEELGAETFAQYVAGFMTKIIIHIVAFLCSFILVVLILRAVIFALNIVSELPILGFVNRIVGGGIGIACALMFLWVLCLVITLLYVTSFGREIYDTVQGNGFLKFIYDYNPVLRLATKI